jgi:hypothetical protein
MTRNLSVDVLKLIMAFMVVGLHTNFLEESSQLGSFLTVEGIFRMAVPEFFLINGFYFLSVIEHKRISVWLKRILILYAFWMFFYIYFWFRPKELSLHEIVKILLTLIFGYHHLWYLPGMIGASVLLFLTRKLTNVSLALISLMLFFIGLSLEYAGNYHFFESPAVDMVVNHSWVYRNFLFFGFPFFCVGYLINKCGLHTKIKIISLFWISILGLCLLLLESYSNFRMSIEPESFDLYLSLLLLCPIVFLLFYKLDIWGESKSLALYSTGIYFIHPLFASIFEKFANFEGTLLTIITLVSSFIAAFGLIVLNKKLKFLL